MALGNEKFLPIPASLMESLHAKASSTGQSGPLAGSNTPNSIPSHHISKIIRPDRAADTDIDAHEVITIMASPLPPINPPPSLIHHHHHPRHPSSSGQSKNSITSSSSLHSHPDDQSHPTYASAQSANTSLHSFDTRTAPESSQVPGYPSTHSNWSSNSNSILTQSPRVAPLVLRDRAFSTVSNASTTSSVKRKALPTTISPIALRYSSGEYLSQTLEEPDAAYTRTYSDDSPTIYQFPATASAQAFAPAGLSRNSSQSTSNNSTLTTDTTPDTTLLDLDSKTKFNQSSGKDNLAIPSPSSRLSSITIKNAQLDSDSPLTTGTLETASWYSVSSASTPLQSTMSIFSSKATPPHNLGSPNPITRSFSHDSYDSNTTVQKAPKSPGASKLGAFFGWGGPASPPSTSTSFSDFSPIPGSPAPLDTSRQGSNASRPSAKQIPTALDIPKANADIGTYYGSAHLQVPLATPTTPIQIEEMEKELRDISAELAGSIRREMDLEDLVERLQAEAQNPPSNNIRRTSDYFSDAGTSSVRFGGESDQKQDELEKMVRKTEQEKATIRMELTDKIQDERQRRKQFEQQVRQLEEKASQVDIATINSMSTASRLKELEAACEDLRRRLTEEKQVKDNFEDLLTALKSELQTSHNERDNLREEIVPQLRARVEGLEAQAAEHEKHVYEQSKMQQELDALKTENLSLKSQKFNTISEEMGPPPARNSTSLSRSNSVATHNMASRSRPPSFGLGRSSSVKTNESREALVEKVKDVEAQRDALHLALRSLLDRQEHKNKEHRKRIKQLEAERDRALSNKPRRQGYNKDVEGLRAEITTLRQRADEAIEQKWQCEKGLSGLKMDLDRAEEEINSLRSLLQANDILIPFDRRASGSRPGSAHATSESLERAYKELQKSYGDSLERVKKLESSASKDEDTLRAMQELEQSLADAMSERAFAQKEVESLRGHNDNLRDAERNHMNNETGLADELRNSAKRVEELAVQVRQQLESNSTLRQRLSETLERGEKDQKLNAEKVLHMQTRLKSLEDKLMQAQQISEDKISQHEEEIKGLRETHNTQLQRVKDGLLTPRLFGPNSPASPMFANIARTPRILSTTSGLAMSVSEHSNMENLKQRVVELETALADADQEMEEVVGRMNVAQIEVIELQNEREDAVRETKRLQKLIEAEKLKAFEQRFASLSG